jgi:hypothetical protein
MRRHDQGDWGRVWKIRGIGVVFER